MWPFVLISCKFVLFPAFTDAGKPPALNDIRLVLVQSHTYVCTCVAMCPNVSTCVLDTCRMCVRMRLIVLSVLLV